MDVRRDALVGAARVIDRTYRMASAMNADPHYVVATIGRLAMTPNVPNAVPCHVELMLEVRSDSNAVLDQFPEKLMAAIADDLLALRLTASAAHISRARPTQCQPLVMGALERSAASLGYACTRLPSGAGHDGVYVTATEPIGMNFIPVFAWWSRPSKKTFAALIADAQVRIPLCR